MSDNYYLDDKGAQAIVDALKENKITALTKVELWGDNISHSMERKIQSALKTNAKQKVITPSGGLLKQGFPEGEGMKRPRPDEEQGFPESRGMKKPRLDKSSESAQK